MKQVVLKFSVQSVNMEDTHDSRFKRATIKAFADGPNAHTHPISLDVLKKGSKTVYDIPILCKYSKFFDDFEGHEPDEIAIGFVKESTNTYSNPIRFEKESDGRTFLVIEGTLWMNYFEDSINVLLRDNHKSVSVELTCQGIDDDERIEVEDFILQGITILGDFVKPAVKGANLVVQFSQAKEEYLKSLEFDNSIKINNSKDAAVSGAWSNPRRRLFIPITEASNSKALLKEAYLIGDFSTNEPEITKFKYPHHVVRSGQLVIHQNGVMAAYKRAVQQGIFSGEVKSHLHRHFRELGLDTENFSEFGISDEEFALNFEDYFESVGEEGMARTKKDELFEEKKDVDNCDEKMEKEDEAEMASDGAEEDKKDEEMCDNLKGLEMDDDSDKKDSDDDDTDEKDKDMSDDKKDEKMSGDMNLPEGYISNPDVKLIPYTEVVKMQSALDALKQANETLEIANKAYMEKISKMSDYDELVKFKADYEDKASREAELKEMNKIFEDISARGVEMSDEDKNALMEKISEFDNIEAWSNFAKAQAFDRAENSPDGVIRIGLPYESAPKSEGSIWSKI